MNLNCHAYRGFFVFDVLSVIPDFVTFGNPSSFKFYAFKLARFVHVNRMFKLYENIVMKFLQYQGQNRMRVKDNVDLISLLNVVILATHILACIWCYIGRSIPYTEEPNSKPTWVYNNGFDDEDSLDIYIFAFYWVLTTLTTVGYGEITGGTEYEYVFSMILEVRCFIE